MPTLITSFPQRMVGWWGKRCSAREELKLNLNNDVGCARREGEGLGLATP